MHTRRQSAKKQTKPMKTFAQEWEKDIRERLTVTKTALVCCRQEERAFYKEKAIILNDVLHFLQGKSPVKKTNLREETEALKMQLQHVASDYEKTNANYKFQKKLTTDLKIQLNRQFNSTNDAVKENKVLLRKVQSMKDMDNQRLKNSLPVKDLKRMETEVPSLQQAAYQTLAATLVNQRETIQKLREHLSQAERKLSTSRREIESMKDWHTHRLENSVPVKHAMATTGVPSLQQAAYQTLAATLSDQRRMNVQLRDNLSEAERNLQQARESFKIKEHELQKKVQTMMQKLESQNAAAKRPNAVVLRFTRLCRWLRNSLTNGTRWIWMATMRSIFFWHNSRST